MEFATVYLRSLFKLNGIEMKRFAMVVFSVGFQLGLTIGEERIANALSWNDWRIAPFIIIWIASAWMLVMATAYER